MWPQNILIVMSIWGVAKTERWESIMSYSCSLFLFKGVLHLLPKISMFCALSQNNQQVFEKKNYASYKKWKTNIHWRLESLHDNTTVLSWLNTSTAFLITVQQTNYSVRHISDWFSAKP